MNHPSSQEAITVALSSDELRYLVACGIALLQNVPETSLTTYTHFSKEQIIAFSKKVRGVMNQNGLDM